MYDEVVISFRFKRLPADAQDALLGAVQTICEIYQVRDQPVVTFGDPPMTASIPSVAELEQIILNQEAQNVDQAKV